jgi:hypothetical protein
MVWPTPRRASVSDTTMHVALGQQGASTAAPGAQVVTTTTGQPVSMARASVQPSTVLCTERLFELGSGAVKAAAATGSQHHDRSGEASWSSLNPGRSNNPSNAGSLQGKNERSLSEQLVGRSLTAFHVRV